MPIQSFLRAMALFACLFPGTLLAANFTANPNDQCSVLLQGEIMPGDFDRYEARRGEFKRITEKLAGHEMHPYVLCLNSPGGSFSEAMKFAGAFGGTRVLDGHTCLSACAVIFLFGRTNEPGADDQWMYRKLGSDARLGFHRPDIRLPTGTGYSSADVEKAFNLAIDATQDFVELASSPIGGGHFVQLDLINEMYDHHGEDYLYIDTTGKAGHWGFAVEGITYPETIDPATAFRVCNNLRRWKLGDLTSAMELPTPSSSFLGVEIVEGSVGSVYLVRGENNGRYSHECLVSVDAREACVFDEDTNRDHGKCDFENGVGLVAFDRLALFPSETPLSQAPGLAIELARAGMQATSATLSNALLFPHRCVPEGKELEVVNVNEFVNIRNRVGFNAQIVGTAQLGERLTFLPSRGVVVREGEDLTSYCIGTCRSHGETPMDGQCFDENMIWYHVRNNSGVEGYVSGRYLRF